MIAGRAQGFHDQERAFPVFFDDDDGQAVWHGDSRWWVTLGRTGRGCPERETAGRPDVRLWLKILAQGLRSA